MKRILKIIAAVVIVLAIPWIIQKVMFGSKPDPAKALADLANKANAGLPKRIDAITTLTRVEYDRKVWRIHYTMDKGAPIDRSQADMYKSYAVKEICAGDMKRILDSAVTIEYLYTYTDSSGERNLRISIPPGSCP